MREFINDMKFKMTNWFIFAILALIFWGLSDFFPKLAIGSLSPKSILVYNVVGAMLVGIVILFSISFRPEINLRGIIFAALSGAAVILGFLFFFYAINRGKLSIVVATAGLYPLLTIILALLVLKEPITLREGIGMILALIAMVLLAG